MAVQIFDRRAKELPDIGLMKVVDSETGHEMYIDTSDKKLRMAHKAYWLKHNEELLTILNECNIDNVSIATDEDFVKKLIILFAKRS